MALIGAVGSGGTLRLWRTRSVDLLPDICHDFKPTAPGSKNASQRNCCSWAPDGSLLVSAVGGSSLSSSSLSSFAVTKVVPDAQVAHTVRISVGDREPSEEPPLSPLAGGASVICAAEFGRTSSRNLALLLRCQADPRAGSFGGGGGGGGDSVLVYDLDQRNVRKRISLSRDGGSSSGQCMAFNRKDSLLAVSHGSAAKTALINPASGVVRSQLEPPPSSSAAAVNALCFSHLRLSLLGGALDSGAVALWDSNADRLIHSFNEHRAPSTGLAFSPINDTLVLSAGLDKRCFCYDVQTRKPVATIKAADPLTCVDLHWEGLELSLGTSRGDVLIYDLRYSRTPTSVVTEACAGERISSVRYRPKVTADKPSGSSSSTTQVVPKKLSSVTNGGESSSKRPSVAVASGDTKENVAVGDLAAVSAAPNGVGPAAGTKTEDTAGSGRDSIGQIFSPLRMGDVSRTSSPFLSNAHVSPAAKEVAVAGLDGQAPSRLSTEGWLFSPLRDQNASPMSSSSLGRTSLSNFGSPALAIIAEEEPLPIENVAATAQSAATGSPPPPPPPKKTGVLLLSGSGTPKRPAVPPPLAPSGPSAAASHTSCPGSPPTGDRTPLSARREPKHHPVVDMRTLLLAFPDCMNGGDKQSRTSSAMMMIKDEGPGRQQQQELRERSQTVSEAAAAASFRQDFIRDVMRETMCDFHSDIKKHLWHIHWEMVKGFQSMEDRMQAMLTEHEERISTLTQENLELRDQLELSKRSRHF